MANNHKAFTCRCSHLDVWGIRERVINADPDSGYGIGDRATPERLGEDNFDDFRRAVRNLAEDAPDELAAALLSFLDECSDGDVR